MSILVNEKAIVEKAAEYLPEIRENVRVLLDGAMDRLKEIVSELRDGTEVEIIIKLRKVAK